MEDTSKSSILLKKLKISAHEEKLIAELASVLIPKTDTPGAVDVNAHLFALKMADDCMKIEDQQRFMSGLKVFVTQADKADFLKGSEAEKNRFVATLNSLNDKSDLESFYRTTKDLVIQGYASSKYFLTKVQVYELVPARYHGCVPVKA